MEQPATLSSARSIAAVWLSLLVSVFAAVAAAVGLFSRGAAAPFTITTARSETVEVYGQGLYRHDSFFVGAGNTGTDVLTLFLGVPLLLLSSILSHRGSIRGRFVSLGALGYFLYIYAGYALGTTSFNELFFLYVAIFSMSLYAFVLTFLSFDPQSLVRHFSPTMPRRGPAIFMIAGGAATVLAWAMLVLPAQFQGDTPAGLGHYTTLTTAALDLGVIAPTAFISGILILHRLTIGYVAALSLLVLEVALLPLVLLQTLSQLAAGVPLTADEVVAPIAGFAPLSLIGAWFLVNILRNVSESMPQQVSSPVSTTTE